MRGYVHLHVILFPHPEQDDGAEFKSEDLVKPVVGRELIWDEPASIPPMPSLFDAAEMAW